MGRLKHQKPEKESVVFANKQVKEGLQQTANHLIFAFLLIIGEFGDLVSLTMSPSSVECLLEKPMNCVVFLKTAA